MPSLTNSNQSKLSCNVSICKIKSFAALTMMQHHWNRTIDTPNSDHQKRKYNSYVHGSAEVVSLVRRKLEDKGIKQLRKNGVLALEYILSFSPEYLRDDNTGKYRKDAKVRYLQWLKATKAWLKNEYGERLISIIIHNDETTSHAHALVLPLGTSKTGKNTLNARGITGGAQKLREIHDSYADAVKHLGLKRGVKGSKAKRTTVKEFYTALNESKKIAKRIGIEPPEKSPKEFNEWTKNIVTLEAAIRKQNELKSAKIDAVINELVETNRKLTSEIHHIREQIEPVTNHMPKFSR
jgi:hypothetical protein